jgi:hypothetical protein
MTTNNSVGDPSIFDSVPEGILTSNGILSTPTWQYQTTDMERVMKRLDKIEERLLIVDPNESLHEKYPALKEAYDAYKIVEKLVK